MTTLEPIYAAMTVEGNDCFAMRITTDNSAFAFVTDCGALISILKEAILYHEPRFVRALHEAPARIEHTEEHS